MQPTELGQLLDSDDSTTRRRAAEVLSQNAEAAAEVAVALVKHAGDDDRVVAEYCVATREELGPPPVGLLDDLAELTHRDNIDVAYWALTLLGRAGAAAAERAPRLLGQAVASSSDLALRQRAAWALGQMGPAAAVAITQLQAALEDESAGVARAAQKALEKIQG